jgi:hypothetical protein
MSKEKGRDKPHSNRFKLLRRASQALSQKPPMLGSVRVIAHKTGPVLDDKGNPVVANPRARKLTNRYARRVVAVETFNPYHQPGSPRRLYQQMKHEGWRGPIDNIISLMNKVS